MTDRQLLEDAAKAAGIRESHGMRWTPEYQSWLGMKQRCTNPKKREYKHYGGRGIKVCDAWIGSFTKFYSDVGKRPSRSHSIDRINVNGNYEPSNVRRQVHKNSSHRARSNRLSDCNKGDQMTDPYAATRRAITRAAAEIGRAMP